MIGQKCVKFLNLGLVFCEAHKFLTLTSVSILGESCVLLQPCPLKDSSEAPLDLRSGEEGLMPGIDCLVTKLPPCPVQTDSSLDLRSGEEMLDLRTGEELIPGETCMPLPLCPIQTDSSLDLRSGEELIPGKTCQPNNVKKPVMSQIRS